MGRRTHGCLLVLVALAGAADVAELMLTSPSLMAGSPTRAVGSALGLAGFLALAGLGARSVRRPGADAVRRWLAALSNLELAGRNGMHKYNNQDHSMMTALLAARNILGLGRYDTWKVNTDAEYHEEGGEAEAQTKGRLVPRRANAA